MGPDRGGLRDPPPWSLDRLRWNAESTPVFGGEYAHPPHGGLAGRGWIPASTSRPVRPLAVVDADVVGSGDRLAGEDVAVGQVGVFEYLVVRHLDLAADQAAGASAANALAA